MNNPTETILSKAVVDAANEVREAGADEDRLKTHVQIMDTVSKLPANKLKAMVVIAVFEDDEEADVLLTNVSGSIDFIDHVANLLKYTSKSMERDADCPCPGCQLKRMVQREPELAELLRGMGIGAADFTSRQRH